jgi:hypothetical protein
MLDNLRSQTSFQPDEEPPAPIQPQKPKRRRQPPRSLDQITGMKAPQRFMLAVMLLMMVCLLGVILLVITGKVVPPLSF